VFTEELLNRLLMEDEEKGANDTKTNDQFIKQLNATMLRVLDNAVPADIFSVLFELLIKYRRNVTYSKSVGLVVKCILKLTKELLSQCNPEKLLLKCHSYLCEFMGDPSKVADDTGTKAIKTILNEMGKLYGERLWDFYKVVQQHGIPDNYMQRWIAVVLKASSGAAPGVNSSMMAGMEGTGRLQLIRQSSGQTPQPAPQTPLQHANTLPATGGSTPSEQSPQGNLVNSYAVGLLPEIIAIVQQIKQGDNVDYALNQLCDALARNPSANLAHYTKEYPKTFTDYLTVNLEKIRYQRMYAPQGGAMQMPGEEHKIHGIQQGFGDPTATGQQGPGATNISNLEDVQNKLNTLKARYGIALKNGGVPGGAQAVPAVQGVQGLPTMKQVTAGTNENQDDLAGTVGGMGKFGNGTMNSAAMMNKLNEVKMLMMTNAAYSKDNQIIAGGGHLAPYAQMSGQQVMSDTHVLSETTTHLATNNKIPTGNEDEV
jgi:hypothetical protein